MATADSENERPRKRRQGESFGSALAQVGVVAVLLAVAVYFYVQRGRLRHEVDTRLKEARALAQRGNPEDLQAALKELDALLALDRTAYEAHVLAADLHTVLWQEQRVAASEGRAREHLAHAEKLESPSSERYGARVVRARVLLHEGKLEEATSLLRGLQQRGASSPRLWLALGLTLRARGELLEARQAFSRATEAAWKDPRYPTTHAEALLDEGLLPQAAEVLHKATTANPQHLQARLTAALVRLHQQAGLEEAQRTVREVTARQDSLTPGLRARLLAVRATLALAQGHLDDALREAGAALVHNPDEHHALLVRARVLAARKDSGARAAFQQALERRRTAPLLYLEGARALREASDTEGALALLDGYEATFGDVTLSGEEGAPAVRALERDGRYWLARGGLLESSGRQDEALAAYDKAIAARGLSLGRAQYAKGALLAARKDHGAARALLEPLAPTDGTGTMAEAYAAMGDVLLASGDAQGGYEHYLRSLLRAKAQGTPAERLQAQARQLGERLKASGPATLVRAWAQDSARVLQAP